MLALLPLLDIRLRQQPICQRGTKTLPTSRLSCLIRKDVVIQCYQQDQNAFPRLIGYPLSLRRFLFRCFRREVKMNILLWVFQVLTAILYAASGVMKVFMFDKIRGDVRSFGALPRQVWLGLGILELVCVVGLLVPSAFRWHPTLTVVAALLLAMKGLMLIWVHVKYAETAPMIRYQASSEAPQSSRIRHRSHKG